MTIIIPFLKDAGQIEDVPCAFEKQAAQFQAACRSVVDASRSEGQFPFRAGACPVKVGAERDKRAEQAITKNGAAG